VKFLIQYKYNGGSAPIQHPNITERQLWGAVILFSYTTSEQLK